MNKKIELGDFNLEKIDITNDKHLDLIKQFDYDSLVKKYIYPYQKSFYDMVSHHTGGDDIFNNFYIINFEDREIGYVEIEHSREVNLNYALVEKERKKGLASKFLRELSSYLLENYKDNVESVNTIIRDENEASINASIKSGFDFIEKKDGFTTYGRKH